ncbi:MAG: hypothetical protein HWN68_19880 [Desulfobacterales bacterium]|nr:hypothetical protein [Desulfobacterales bacterium]
MGREGAHINNIIAGTGLLRVNQGTHPSNIIRIIILWLTGWFSVVGFDFLLHAGLLSSLYSEPSTFLLPLQEAFRLIPIGYLSFLMLNTLLLWLMMRMNITGWREGSLFGLKVGAMIWGGHVLGLFSISTADPRLLAGWFIGQTIEIGLAGAVYGSGLAGKRVSRLFINVFVLVLFFVIVSILIQNLELIS